MEGLPLELMTFITSTLIGGGLSIWAARLKNATEWNNSLIKLASKDQSSWKEAREYGKQDSGFSWTRRTLAFIAMLSIIALPKFLVIAFPSLAVTYGYTEFNPGFLFFSEGHHFTEWKSFTGLVITPLDTHLMSAITGMYFGGSLVNHVGKR